MIILLAEGNKYCRTTMGNQIIVINIAFGVTFKYYPHVFGVVSIDCFLLGCVAIALPALFDILGQRACAISLQGNTVASLRFFCWQKSNSSRNLGVVFGRIAAILGLFYNPVSRIADRVEFGRIGIRFGRLSVSGGGGAFISMCRDIPGHSGYKSDKNNNKQSLNNSESSLIFSHSTIVTRIRLSVPML